MTGFRLSAQQRERHDRAECGDLCPACAAIEAMQDREPRHGRDLLTTQDYREYQ
jgi:hypothetical protein